MEFETKVYFGGVGRQGGAVKEPGAAGGALNFRQGKGGTYGYICKDIRWRSMPIESANAYNLSKQNTHTRGIINTRT